MTLFFLTARRAKCQFCWYWMYGMCVEKSFTGFVSSPTAIYLSTSIDASADFRQILDVMMILLVPVTHHENQHGPMLCTWTLIALYYGEICDNERGGGGVSRVSRSVGCMDNYVPDLRWCWWRCRIGIASVHFSSSLASFIIKALLETLISRTEIVGCPSFWHVASFLQSSVR